MSNRESDLFEAVKNNDVEGAEAALKRGANPSLVRTEKNSYPNDAFENTRTSILLEAISREREKIVKLLLERGAKPNEKGTFRGSRSRYRSWSPLHLACQKQNVAIIKMLLEHGAAPDDGYELSESFVRDSQPCLLAAFGECRGVLPKEFPTHRHIEIFKIFLDHGVDVNRGSDFCMMVDDDTHECETTGGPSLKRSDHTKMSRESRSYSSDISCRTFPSQPLGVLLIPFRETRRYFKESFASSSSGCFSVHR